MRLLDALFRSKTMEQVLSDDSFLKRMLEVEAALAGAEAETGLIPHAAAKCIVSCCILENLDLEALARDAKRSGNIAIPLMMQLTEAVSAQDPEAAKFVHWGATSQDVIDTAVVLQTREALSLLLQDIESACSALRSLTERHRNTIMPGRTWMQHAVPITFGLKTAYMLSALHRQSLEVRSAVASVSVLQFGGAAGTLASLGDDGLRVAGVMAERLKLKTPSHPWHSHRAPIAEVATALGVLCGVLGKIARDVALMCQTEVAEVSETNEKERGGSSTMPQKNNPVQCAAILANVTRIPGLVSTVLSAMVQEHERGLGGWHAEWETLPEIVSLSAGAAERLAELLSSLQVDMGRMRKNVDLTKGLVFAEAISTALSHKVGKSTAHAIVEHAAKKARGEDRSFAVVLRESDDVKRHLSEKELLELFRPENYLGSAQEFIDRVLAECGKAAEVSDAIC